MKMKRSGKSRAEKKHENRAKRYEESRMRDFNHLPLNSEVKQRLYKNSHIQIWSQQDPSYFVCGLCLGNNCICCAENKYSYREIESHMKTQHNIT